MDLQELECILRGRVQGVNFRRFAKRHAEELGLVGYAQNNDDGSFEVVAQGDREVLETFLELLKKGPHFAEINDIEVRWHEKPQDSLMNFEIL